MLTNNGSYDELISRVEELVEYNRQIIARKGRSEFNDRKSSKLKEDYNRFRKNINGIRCFQCGELRHIKSQCNKNEEKIHERKGNAFRAKNEKEHEDIEKVKVNGFFYNVIFDTDADSNFISKNILIEKNLDRGIRICEVKEEYKMLNGTALSVGREIGLKFEYKDREYKEVFKVIEDGYKGIIIGNKLVKRLLLNKKEIPIQCEFNTKGNTVVSWTRPIRNRHDQVEFLELVKELKDRGIIEPSKSIWLNPVVLQRKKMES